MTEDEARQKWCPYAMYVIDTEGYPAGNRFGGYEIAEERCKCIASDCMAWVKVETFDNVGYCGAFRR